MLFDKYLEHLHQMWISSNTGDINDKAIKELHANCTLMKALASQKGMDMALTARELCGGHGYSTHSRLPDIICSQNVQITWEGANDVLIQQTAKFLVSAFQKFMTKNVMTIDALQFFSSFGSDEQVRAEFEQICTQIEDGSTEQVDIDLLLVCLKRIHQLRLKILSECAAEYFAQNLQNDSSLFNAFNKSLPEHMIAVSVCYGHYVCSEHFAKATAELGNGNELAFFKKVLCVALINSLRQFSYYLSGSVRMATFNKLFELERVVGQSIIPDLIVFLDIVTMPDEILCSTLGVSNGEYYQEIIRRLYDSQNPLFGPTKSWLKLKEFNRSQ